MTKEQFKNKYVGKAVHCDTEEKAKEFLKLAHDFGWEWVNTKSLLKHDNWGVNKSKTCYRCRMNCSMVYESISFYESKNVEIVQFESEEKKMKKTKKVFDLGVFIAYMQNQKRSNEDIKKTIRDWALDCHGLTEKEMSKINKTTLDKWMKEVEVEIKPELSEKEVEVLKALKVLGFEWIARDENSYLYAYDLEPVKNTYTYSASDYSIRLDNNLFLFITWEDEEPTSIEELLCGLK